RWQTIRIRLPADGVAGAVVVPAVRGARIDVARLTIGIGPRAVGVAPTVIVAALHRASVGASRIRHQAIGSAHVRSILGVGREAGVGPAPSVGTARSVSASISAAPAVVEVARSVDAIPTAIDLAVHASRFAAARDAGLETGARIPAAATVVAIAIE